MNREIILASNNQKKLKELKEIAGDRFEIKTLKEAGISSDPEETGKTFEENSLIKAKAACLLSGSPAIADDSGLVVHALNDEPGVYSARFASMNGISGENSDEENNRYLLKRMKGIKDRSCAFVSVITMYFPDGSKIVTEGRIEGKLMTSPRGNNGFGYDPLFFVESKGKTMAELSPEEKNGISHRGKALRKLFYIIGGDHDND